MNERNKKDEVLLGIVLKALEDKKAENIAVYELQENRALADYFVIATGHVHAHLRALIETLRMALKTAGYAQPRVDRSLDTGWMVLDGHDIVVHVFTPEERAYYDLDSLWEQHAHKLKIAQ